jgi:non-lysosomal glucosylceramidase
MGAKDYGNPDYQLGEGCLVDQLVGQYMAHVCGLLSDNFRLKVKYISLV